MTITDQVVLLIALFFVLGFAANRTVDALFNIGKIFKIKSFIMGFLILGMATSIPEFLIGLNSIANKNPFLSFGNLIGANIVLLTFITGLAAILNKKLFILRSFSKKEIYLASILIFLPVLLAIDKEITQLDGVILIVTFAIYFLFVAFEKPHYDVEHKTRVKLKPNIFLFLMGLAIMIFSSKYIVATGTQITTLLRLSPLVLGILIFSLGTNLPEIILTLKSYRSTKKYLAFGDVMGSAAANTLIAGIVGFTQPFKINDYNSLIITALTLLISIALFASFVISGRMITRREGIFLLIFYGIFITILTFTNLKELVVMGL